MFEALIEHIENTLLSRITASMRNENSNNESHSRHLQTILDFARKILA